MIKTKYYILIITCLWLQAGLATTPSAFYSALKKIYPLAADVEWSQQGNYHTADFIQNGFDTKVWMNINAQWVMTNTDLQTADQLPPGFVLFFILFQKERLNNKSFFTTSAMFISPFST